MVHILVIYDSRTGNTEQMAKAVAEGAKRSGADVIEEDDVSLDNMKRADGIILGSPTHFGTMSDRMKA